MSGAFTAGPWQYLDEWVTHPVVTSTNFSIEVRGPNEKNDARLIAAAPLMLEACRAMVEWDERERDHAVDFYARMELCRSAFEKTRAAIAAATGEQP